MVAVCHMRRANKAGINAMTGHKIKLPGYRIDKKTGKPVRIDKGSVSDKLKRKDRKKIVRGKRMP